MVEMEDKANLFCGLVHLLPPYDSIHFCDSVSGICLFSAPYSFTHVIIVSLFCYSVCLHLVVFECDGSLEKKY